MASAIGNWVFRKRRERFLRELQLSESNRRHVSSLL